MGLRRRTGQVCVLVAALTGFATLSAIRYTTIQAHIVSLSRASIGHNFSYQMNITKKEFKKTREDNLIRNIHSGKSRYSDAGDSLSKNREAP